jgi:hypothetical protein
VLPKLLEDDSLYLDPGSVMDKFPKNVTEEINNLDIIIKSDILSVKMPVEIFLKKSYLIAGNYLEIGNRKLDLDTLIISVTSSLRFSNDLD